MDGPVAERHAIRERLQQQLERLERRTQKIESDLQRPGHRDSGEQALQRENDEVLEQLSEVELHQIAQIRRALSRLEEGRYGDCRVCGGEIGEARLGALPTATTCIDCADAGEEPDAAL